MVVFPKNRYLVKLSKEEVIICVKCKLYVCIYPMVVYPILTHYSLLVRYDKITNQFDISFSFQEALRFDSSPL